MSLVGTGIEEANDAESVHSVLVHLDHNRSPLIISRFSQKRLKISRRNIGPNQTNHILAGDRNWRICLDKILIRNSGIS